MVSNMKKENQAQGECLKRMKGEVLDLIDLYAVEMRDVINTFERDHKREPTGEDLLYILCEHHNRDLTK